MPFEHKYFYFLYFPVPFHHLPFVPAMSGSLPWSRSCSTASTSSFEFFPAGHSTPLPHIFQHKWSTNLHLTLVLSILLLPPGSSASLDLGLGPFREVVGAGLCCHAASRHSARPGRQAAEGASPRL